MVTVITSPSCQPCRFTKKRLNDLGVEFVERDVSTDSEALELAKNLGYNSTPVVILDTGEHWQGLRPDRLDALLAA